MTLTILTSPLELLATNYLHNTSFPTGKLFTYCHYSTLMLKIVISSLSLSDMVIVQCPEVIYSGLTSVWQTGLFSDVEVLVGSQSFRSHRVILSAHSPYFQAMFTLPMKESATSQVVFSDLMSCHVFQSLLTFMYEGKSGISTL